MQNVSNMSAEPKNLFQILTGDSNFEIPVFQRDYSWKDENWKELWNDISNGFKENNKHYLGSIVLVNNKGVKEILDGQQRLITLSILIKSIHWCIKELINNNIDVEQNNIRLSKIGQLIFEEDIYNPSEVSNKIKLNDTNDCVYNNYIVKDEEYKVDVDSKSNELLIKCYKFFKKIIKETCINNENSTLDIKTLLDYFKYISENIIVVEITVSDYANAYVIFETLNDRGLELTVTDLLKNYLFSKVPPKKHRKVHLLWNKIINRIGEKNLTKYIRHFWNSRNKKVTEKSLFKALKNYIESGVLVEEFLVELEQVSIIYKAIVDVDNEIWNNDVELIRYLNEIKLYKVDLCYPVILAAQLNIEKATLKRKIFKLCSRISFRYITICNGSPGDLENAYNKLCLKIIKEKDDLDFNYILNSMKEFTVPKEEFIASFTNKILKTKNNKRKILEILKAIERNIGGTLPEDYTIEHILPESPSEEWQEEFGDDIDHYKYRIGNYTLLKKDKNSEIGNKMFSDKKIEYKNSAFKMTKEIANKDKWTISEIEERQRKMGKIVETIWSI
ncbi:DUF262 domain-containing protein [Clostridium massiliodielmoense]|uniref:DUF262 domain-containing protein n=1 Tax=Clostridium massiliodielmoense TaxID=1776385 RepID=UPI0004DB0187|nr:DUF262 domain-containing protein [Clostridium massiliodielmoense]KEH96704.1 hypothetical protein Z962_06795 [Clostridium botulinum C/D str. BKT12695]